ncbi:ribosome biogenesis regulatory protein, putative [Eimeria tenella]|uniref:Ribosome biogenesis regulatory protein n=1 Tax=Eimeria tenella TaxID=5802 RepID=U6KSR6_EIMTE|nr:ribosome biogenesis regulatory protein, putative [Eimeria tenella]CDJ41006.1 ribosome biogenesis regulatory protein, putative [Eimeria tenella]|eukprot:XP_013231756.1 ribosome biogenesis regulatory protein, putative [Eimeria tenella]
MASAAPVRVDLASLGPGLPDFVEEPDSLTYHLHHLIATDLQPLEISTDLEEKTQKAAQLFVTKLFSLPRHTSEDGVYVQLPPPPKIDTFRFPRTLKLPTARPLTRWQAFAKAKGIVKRKRSRLIWSEELKDWIPRWGPRGPRAVQQQQQAVLEEKGAVTLRSRNLSIKKASAAAAAAAAGGRGQKRKRLAVPDPAAAAAAAAAGNEGDLFTQAKKQRQLEKAKQKLRELRNQAEAKAGVAATRGLLQAAAAAAARGAPRGAPTLPTGIPVLSAKKHRGKSKQELKELLLRAQISTASQGQHEKFAAGSLGGPTLQQQKKQKPQHHSSAAAEAAAYKEQLRLLLATKAANKEHAGD